jgi:hypothetical protein
VRITLSGDAATGGGLPITSGVVADLDVVLPFVPLFVLGAVVVVAMLLRSLLAELRFVRESSDLHHGVLTAVGTMHGLITALESGLETGGMSPQTRAAIYRAHDEQVAFVMHTAREAAGSTGPGGHSEVFNRRQDDPQERSADVLDVVRAPGARPRSTRTSSVG